MYPRLPHIAPRQPSRPSRLRACTWPRKSTPRAYRGNGTAAPLRPRAGPPALLDYPIAAVVVKGETHQHPSRFTLATPSARARAPAEPSRSATWYEPLLFFQHVADAFHLSPFLVNDFCLKSYRETYLTENPVYCLCIHVTF